MLAGLSALELGRLRISLGYGTHKKGRPLSPIEVATLLRRACDAGHTLGECAREIRIHETGLARFLRILELPEDLQHLVGWGSGRDMVGFSCAAELVRIGGADNQRIVTNAILENGFNSKEVRQVAQLVARSGRSVDVCLKEVLGMRPTIEKRYVFIGSIADDDVQATLNDCSQRERDAVLAAGMEHISLVAGSGRLGSRIFTLVGDERFEAAMREVGKEHIEARLRIYIAENLGNGESNC